MEMTGKVIFGGVGAAIGGLGGFYFGGPTGAKIGCTSGMSMGISIHSSLQPTPEEKHELLMDKVKKVALNTFIISGSLFALKLTMDANLTLVDGFNKTCYKGAFQNLPCFIWTGEVLVVAAISCSMIWQVALGFKSTLKLLH